MHKMQINKKFMTNFMKQFHKWSNMVNKHKQEKNPINCLSNNFTNCQNIMNKHKLINYHNKFDQIISQIAETLWINTNTKLLFWSMTKNMFKIVTTIWNHDE